MHVYIHKQQHYNSVIYCQANWQIIFIGKKFYPELKHPTCSRLTPAANKTIYIVRRVLIPLKMTQLSTLTRWTSQDSTVTPNQMTLLKTFLFPILIFISLCNSLPIYKHADSRRARSQGRRQEKTRTSFNKYPSGSVALALGQEHLLDVKLIKNL